MSHADARLTVHGRAELVRRVVDQGRPVARVVIELNVSRATATNGWPVGELRGSPACTIGPVAPTGYREDLARPHRPQTNGKAERFNRTLADERAYLRPFDSSAERTAALPAWLHTYNHHRSHTALDGHPPISRIAVNNAAGHYT